MEVSEIKSPTNKAEFIELLKIAVSAGTKLLEKLDEIDEILLSNAIAEAKVELDICPEMEALQQVKPSQSYLDFMASLERGDHLDTIKFPL